ncbi:hypothetical protein RB653_003973 [Dictyostelium firmibasis]|uniref:ADP-ribosylation factor n=1 Tax=Dictyostelium firmibasis TaxID=79012 RepID=A0AAN7U9T5_9MYCE
MEFIKSFLKNLFSFLVVKKVMILGVENVGKTTLLYNICNVNSQNENNKNILHSTTTTTTTIPTNGFNIESIVIDEIRYDFWDIGGKETNRICYRHYLTNDIDSIIFVFDSSDINSLEESKKEFQYLKNQNALKNVSFLLVANKQDLQQPIEINDILKNYFDNVSLNDLILMSQINNYNDIMKCINRISSNNNY